MTQTPVKLLAVLAALGAVASAAGCADTRATLEATGICGMTDDCTFGATCDAYHMGDIAYDPTTPAIGVNPPPRLQFAVEVKNQLPNNASTGTSRINSNDAHITGYRLEYSSGGPATTTLDVGHHFVPAGGSSLVWVYAANSTAPFGRYVVDITFIGYYDNGREFETPPFPVGLEVGIFTFGCAKAGDLDGCPGTGAQGLFACVTP